MAKNQNTSPKFFDENFAARSTIFLANLARKQKSLATPAIN
jgi:hypothetical protein